MRDQNHIIRFSKRSPIVKFTVNKLHLELHDLELILTEQHWSPGIQQPH